jgi:hypothetical protein
VDRSQPCVGLAYLALRGRRAVGTSERGFRPRLLQVAE